MKNILKIDPLIKITDKIIDLPIVIRVTKFDTESAAAFSEQMSKAHNTNQQIIPIIVDSYGGEVYALLSMISDINNSKIPVATIATGKAMSCGAVLLTCGVEGHRYMDPNSVVMIHDISNFLCGKNEEIKADAKETDRLQKQIFRLMAKNCGQKDQDYFLKIIHEKSHAEWYLTYQEAKRHNVVNHARVPSFTTYVKVETVFE
jgi:ATP-dependent Clp protease, protease subunit